jgi:hypothetical protein
MQILSALDAISPAFARTKLVLFSPFRKGRTWKLSATAYLATAGTIFLPFPLLYLGFLPILRKTGAGTLAIWALIACVILLMALYLWIFHLCSHIRFAFFDIVLNRGEFVAPAWRKYGPQSRKFSAFKVLLGTLVTAIFAVPVVGYFHHFFAIVWSIAPGQQPSPDLIFGLFAGYFFAYFGFGLFFFASTLLNDFIVPTMALEDASLSEAFRRFGKFLGNEPGQFTLYALMKLILGLAGYMGAAFLAEIAFLLVMAIVALIAIAIGFLLHMAGVSMTVLTVLGGILAAACYFFFMGYGLPIVIGTVLTFLESYKLYFLGGRYLLLGELLERSTPPPMPYIPPPNYATPSPPVAGQ